MQESEITQHGNSLFLASKLEQPPPGGGVNKPKLHPPNDNDSDVQSWEKDKPDNPVIKYRDGARKQASDLQRGVAEVQAARYETTLYRLMRRSGDNYSLIRSLNAFTRVLDNRSFYGVSDEPLTAKQVDKLIKFFEDRTKELSSPEFFS